MMQGTKQFIHDIKRITHRKFTAEEKIDKAYAQSKKYRPPWHDNSRSRNVPTDSFIALSPGKFII